jgi:hypothetical protein
MTAVRAAQLVYSNVEAEHSPSNRRGFQVWLCSSRLKEHQREIARRLEDFEWPADDAAADRPTRRLTFFRIGTGDFVVARTVPIAERDALNRAGRFHAHAVVLPPGEFARVGNNPFAVFDHFRFQNGPREVIEAGRVGNGLLPDEAEIPVGSPRDCDAEAARRILPLVVRWLDGADDPRPVAVPVPPDRLADLLRALFQMLPPALRAKASFDTLSTGQALGTLHYRFVGAYDAATLRDWPYRRSYRLDVEAGEFLAPPAATEHAGLDHLAAAWVAQPGLTDAEREASYRLLKSLGEASADAVPPQVPERAVELIRGAPHIEPGTARLVQSRLTTDLPYPQLRQLVERAATEWVGDFGRESLEKLAQPLRPLQLAGWILERAEAEPLAAAVAAEQERWAAEQLAQTTDAAARLTVGKLYLAGVRWQPGAAARLAALREQPGWAALIDGWLRDWFARFGPLAPWLASEATAWQLAEGVFLASPRFPATAADELELHLFLNPPGDLPADAMRGLHFAAAFRRLDEPRMIELLAGAEAHRFADWAAHLACRAGLSFSAEFRNFDGVPCPGVTVAGSVPLVRACTAHPLMRLRLAARGAAEVLTAAAGVIRDGSDSLVGVQREYDVSNWRRLHEELGKVSTSAFRAFAANNLQRKFRFPAVTAEPTEIGAWLGVRPEPPVPDPDVAKLWREVAGAARTPARVAALLAALLRVRE